MKKNINLKWHVLYGLLVNFFLFSVPVLSNENENNFYQGEKSISGVVVDLSGQPIPGVSVVVKGTTRGVTTDVNGTYSISNIPENATLEFSFVGMKSQEIPISNKTTINLVMQEEAIGLEEFVAIGYGTQSTRKVTSSVSRVDTKKMKNTSYSNMASALSGLTQGIILKQTGGGPAWDAPTLSIRGGGEPLYVIDGIISLKSDFARMNAADVEDISILKDAGAAAVYGSRAANGVVLVTTRNSLGNKISYSNNYSWDGLATSPEMLDAYKYVQFYNKAATVAGETPYSPEEIEKWKIGTDPGYKSTIFMDEVFKKYAQSQRHNLTIQGKEQNSDYLISVSSQNQGSRYMDNDTHYMNVYNVLAKVGKNYDKLGLKFNAKLGSSFRDYKSTIWDHYYIFKAVNDALPIWQPFNSNGHYMQISGLFNPFYMQDEANGYNQIKNRRYTGVGTLKWHVPKVKGLDINFTANFETDLYHEKNFTSMQPFYTADDQPIYQEKPSLSEVKNNSQNYTIQSAVNYKNSFGKHYVEGSAIYEEYEYKVWNMAASRKDYMSEVLDNLSFGSQSGLTNSGTMDEFARRGFIGRLMYDYNDKYLVTGSFRYDASERFRKGDRWGFFPSLSLGWRISKEKLMGDILSKAAISNMKLRLSYGEVGNDDIARFAYLSTYSVVDKRYFQDGQWLTGIYDNGLPAGDISWYTQTNYNIGVDLDFFDYKLQTTFDAFYYRTFGFLVSPAADYIAPLGTGLPQINKGSQRRGGYEFTVKWKNTIRDFNYDIGANLTHYELLWEENPQEDITTLKNPYLRTTHASSTYYTIGYFTQGYYKDMADVLNSPRLEGEIDILPGDLKYVDTNGDGRINSEDKRKIGSGTFPKYYFGLNFNANYRGFNFEMVMQGAAKFDIQSWQMYDRLERGAASITRKGLTDIWTPENPDARFPRVNLATGRTANVGWDNTSNFWLLDASYGRLKNLQIGYDLKYSLLKDMKAIQGLYIYFNGTNLFTIAPGLDNLYDPEDKDGNYASYPIEKSFSFGVNIDF